MNIEKQLEASVKNQWVKYVTRVEPFGKFKELANNRNNLLNTYFQQFGFAGIGDKWHKISKQTAHQIIQSIASASLFDCGEHMPEDKASSIAKSFLSNFSESSKCFTNLQPESWEPDFNLSNHHYSIWDIDAYTDEEGRGYITCISVIVYDKNNIGILSKLESS